MMKNSRQIEYMTSMMLSATLLMLVDCSADIQGSGVSKTESRNVDKFHSIAHNSVGIISVTVGPPQNVSITFDDNLLDLVETQVVDGELRIYTKSSFNTPIGLKVKISQPSLESCKVSGVGSVTVFGKPTSRQTKSTGVGKIRNSDRGSD